MQAVSFPYKRAVVVGLARSGVAAANALAQAGCQVTVTDSKGEGQLAEALSRLYPGVALALAGHPLHLLDKTEAVVVSPGVPMDIPFLAGARGRGLPIWGELELAYRLCCCPIIAITGTNGKSTTTSLIGHILSEGGKAVIVAGNIGLPLTAALMEAGGGRTVDYIVAEVSSFQLETIERFRPAVGVVLNITPDHLDRHGTFATYVAIKARLTSNQTADDDLVLSADDPVVREISGRARTVFFSRRGPVRGGVFVRGGKVVGQCRGPEEVILEVEEIPLVGAHNLENVLAAVAVACLCRLDPGQIGSAIRGFRGLEHRMEFVRQVQGARFFNDSKGTNVGAVIRSLESFPGPLVLIAGGRDKAADFAPLRPLVQERVRCLILLGEARDRLRSALGGCTEVVEVGSLEEAVAKAASVARPGDVVLLSPACASFDMFENFEERGRVFKQLVDAL